MRTEMKSATQSKESGTSQRISRGITQKTNFFSFIFYSTIGFVILKKIFFADLLDPIPWPVATILAAFWYIRSVANNVRSESAGSQDTLSSHSPSATVKAPKVPPVKLPNTNLKSVTKVLKTTATVAKPTFVISRKDPMLTEEKSVRRKVTRSKVIRTKVVREKRKSPDRHY